QSSANFDKKSFTLRLDDTLGHDKPLGLYGLPAFDHWTLNGPWFYDRTFIYNAFIYALSNRLGRWAARTQFVEVYFNANGGDLDYNDYVGVYMLTDSLKVDPKRINIKAIASTDVSGAALTGGYVLKIDQADSANFYFETKNNFPSL